MLGWIGENSDWISAVISLVVMIVWILYLNLFFLDVRRSRRPMILVSRGVGVGSRARLFISNMGAEPIYVSALIADAQSPDATATAYITSSDAIVGDDVSTAEATMEGPLGSGSYLDAGSFSDILSLVEDRADAPIQADRIETLTLTVVASTGYSALISAGRKSYSILRDGEDILFHPTSISTEQLRNRSARRKIRRRLEHSLDKELEDRRAAEDRPRQDATA